MDSQLKQDLEDQWQAEGGWNKELNMSNRAASALADGWMTIPILQKHLQNKFKIKLSRPFIAEKLDELEEEFPAWHHIGKTMQRVLFYDPETIEAFEVWIVKELQEGRKIDAPKQVQVNLFDGWDFKTVAAVKKGSFVILENGEKFRIPSQVSIRSRFASKKKDVRGQFRFHSIKD